MQSGGIPQQTSPYGWRHNYNMCSSAQGEWWHWPVHQNNCVGVSCNHLNVKCCAIFPHCGFRNYRIQCKHRRPRFAHSKLVSLRLNGLLALRKYMIRCSPAMAAVVRVQITLTFDSQRAPSRPYHARITVACSSACPICRAEIWKEQLKKWSGYCQLSVRSPGIRGRQPCLGSCFQICELSFVLVETESTPSASGGARFEEKKENRHKTPLTLYESVESNNQLVR